VRLYGIIVSPIKEKLAEVIERLRTHAKIVDHTAVATELLKASEFRNRMTTEPCFFSSFKLMRGPETVSRDRLDSNVRYEKWLRPPNIREIYHHFVCAKSFGTCDWIWTHPTFVSWNKPSSSTASDRLLCIHGKNGCGKSVLASSIAEVLRSQQQHVSFFSFSGTDASRQTLDALVRALLWQQLQEITYEQGFSIMHSLMSASPPLPSELWDAFKSAAALVTEPMYWIIDGVDECQDSIQGLFGQILDLLTTHKNAHAILLGRPHMLGTISPTTYTIEINPGLTKADIDVFIGEEISKSELLKVPELRHSVFKVIQEKSDGMFLWVKLMMDDLCKSASKYEVTQRLRTLPRGLEETYRFLLMQLVERLDDFELSLARSVLAFTIVSCRALKLEELQYAHAVESKSASNSSDERPFQDYLLVGPMQKILHVCAGLITITDGVVRLIHLSVKEFLTRPEGDWLCKNDHKIKSLRVDLKDSHRAFASVCLDYLGMTEYGFPLQGSDSLPELWTRYPLLEYASRYMFQHLPRSNTSSSTIIDKLSRFLHSDKSVSWIESVAILLVDDQSTGSEIQEFKDFISWLYQGDHEQELSGSLEKGLKKELAKRVRDFGENDSRTEQWRLLLNLTEDGDSDAETDSACGTSDIPFRNMSSGFSHVTDLLNHHTTLPLQRQVDLLLKLQCQLRRAKILTDPLELLLRIILQKASRLSVYVLLIIGEFYERVDKDDKALEVYQAALAKFENREVLTKFAILFKIGRIQDDLQQYDMALESFQKVLTGRERILGSDHRDTLDSTYWVGNAYLRLQDDKALEYFQKALTGRERILGSDHRDTLDSTYWVGVAYFRLYRDDKALDYFQKGLTGEERILGSDHRDTLNSTYWIGIVYRGLKDYDQALKWLQVAFIGRKKLLGTDHKDTLNTMHLIAIVYSELGQYDKALEWFQKTLLGRQKLLGADHKKILLTMHKMAIVYYELEQYDKALEWFQKILLERQKLLGADHKDVLTTKNWIEEVIEISSDHREESKLSHPS
jgi:tetratricopeptide (TPR) repeat protein/energy-coupling factor transporter ATP-binding protein EcfA2